MTFDEYQDKIAEVTEWGAQCHARLDELIAEATPSTSIPWSTIGIAYTVVAIVSIIVAVALTS